MAQNLELCHLCQMQNAGDRWCNPHSKQVSCAMYVPKSLKMTAFCNLLRWFPPIFFLNTKLNKTHLQNRTLSTPSSLFLPCAIHVRPKHCSSAGWGGSAVAKVCLVNVFCLAWCWEKNMGGNQHRRLQKSVIFRDIDGATDLFWMGGAPSIPCILHLT